MSATFLPMVFNGTFTCSKLFESQVSSACSAKIDVEYSKTDDIYALVEKDVLQVMHNNYVMNDENVNILKYIRKNLKIIDRLEDISARLMFARLGGKL